MPRSEEIDQIIESAGIETLEYNVRWGLYRVRLAKGDVEKKTDTLQPHQAHAGLSERMSTRMKDKIERGTRKVVSAVKARPAETRCSLIGAAVVLAVVGAVIGNGYGISKDRPVQ